MATILYIVGALLAGLGLTMLAPAAVDAASDTGDWTVFISAGAFTGFFGVSLMLANRAERARLTVRQTFLLTALAWAAICAFGAVPLHFAGLGISYTDALFESVSGLTTTGASVLVGLDAMPPGILLWRALLHWIGGIGIIGTAVAILPILRIGGMQLFRTESSDRSEKAMPRARQIAISIVLIYVALSVVCMVLLWAAGMTLFEAVCHAMSILATGGFSTSDASLGHFPSPVIHWIAIVFMILGCLPFVLYIRAAQGDLRPLYRSSQVRWLLGLIVIVVFFLTLWRWQTSDTPLPISFHHVAFSVVSVISTTGLATTDWAQWGSFSDVAFVFLMFVGGCTGSTSGGIKIFRFEVMAISLRGQFRRLIQPHAVVVPLYGGRPLSDEIAQAVTSFVTVYVATVMVVGLGLGALGLDLLTSLSAAATAVGNVGPGLGPVIGPVGNFSTVPDAAKWLLSVGMLAGRLELYTLLVLLMPAFWRR